ncbi:MAG: YceI family protein [Puniceicoccaceae bacterium]
MKSVLAFLIFGLASAAATPIETVFVPDESHLSFRVRHFVMRVTGELRGIEGTLTFNPDLPEKSTVSARLPVSAIDTDNKKRDNHLRGDDFFKADSFPEVHFQSTQWAATRSETRYLVTGDLTMRGTTREITLEARLVEMSRTPEDLHVMRWEVETKLDRRSWGITYGRGAIGNDVTITLEVLAQQPVRSPAKPSE